VPAYLLELKRSGEITADEFRDADFTQNLRAVVRRWLQAELSGDESNKELRQLVVRAIDDEIA
jgi:hypothetical protein